MDAGRISPGVFLWSRAFPSFFSIFIWSIIFIFPLFKGISVLQSKGKRC
ncbi:hypothetical protein BCBMB205_32670 [Bacillus velezensis]|nr:hypothetical protein BCBMB205_32670 [Bacillus velezensis]